MEVKPLKPEDVSEAFATDEHNAIGNQINLKPASDNGSQEKEKQLDDDKETKGKDMVDSVLPHQQAYFTLEHNIIGNLIKLKLASDNESQEKEKQLNDKVTNALKGKDMVDAKFTAPEHLHIGDMFTTPEHLHIAREMQVKILTLPNGVQLTFGQIIALAGDYYGVPEDPIANLQGNDQVDGPGKRFMAAYHSLAIKPHDEVKKQLDKLLTMLNEEAEGETTVDGRRKSGKSHHSDQEWDEATGGRWLAGLPLVPGQMMKLAMNNYDHFLPQAKEAYLIGHQLAMEKAREAGESRADDKEKKLDEAYSLDAFACHFLTDSFSSGHIRTPRFELAKSTTPANVGHLLSKYMHDEDNEFGLRVTNMRGDKWISYGDGMLMKECSTKNLALVTEAVQKSADQVHQAFLNPKATPPPSSAVTDLIPFVDTEEKNNLPLFQVKDGKLRRRSDINNLQDTKTASNWWGSTTVAKLQFRRTPENSAI